MVNQSPFVINLALDYSGPTKTQGRLLYNVSGRQIVEVGSLGLDDSYLQPRHLLDLTVSQDFDSGLRLAVSAENILNAPYLVTLGNAADEERATRRYTNGVTFSVSAGYSY
jgi:outer membrane receptor protein involved in Fe transport